MRPQPASRDRTAALALLWLVGTLGCGREATQTTLIVDSDPAELESPAFFYFRLHPASSEPSPPTLFDVRPLSLEAEPGVGEVAFPQSLPFVPLDGQPDVSALVEVGVMTRGDSLGRVQIARTVPLSFVQNVHVMEETRLDTASCLVDYVCCREGREVPVEEAFACVPRFCLGGATPDEACTQLTARLTCGPDGQCIPIGECEDGQEVPCGGPIDGDPSCRGVAVCRGGVFDACDATQETERCGTLEDEDCDGQVDEEDCACAGGDCSVQVFDVADGLRQNLVPDSGGEEATQSAIDGWRYRYLFQRIFGATGPFSDMELMGLSFLLMEAARDDSEAGWYGTSGMNGLGSRGAVFMRDWETGRADRMGTAVLVNPENQRQPIIEWQASAQGVAEMDIEIWMGGGRADIDWHILTRQGGVLRDLETRYLSADGLGDSTGTPTESAPRAAPAVLRVRALVSSGDALLLLGRMGDEDADDRGIVRGVVRFYPQ